MTRRLLLISNSTMHGGGYLDHCMEAMRELLGERRRIVFVPFALFDREKYAAAAAERLGREGYEVRALPADPAGFDTLAWGEAVFVGGGNTFRLLDTLQRTRLLEAIRERVLEGMVYTGASAGSNIAAPTIKTTNDMPIVEPRSFDALGLVQFQINPHYIDTDPDSTHMGETREQRLLEFLEENDTPIVALREGSWIRIEGDDVRLGGSHAARVLRRGSEPEERRPGADLSDLAAVGGG